MTAHSHGYDPSCTERKVGKCMVVIDPADVHQVRRLDDLTQKYLDDPSVPQYMSTADLLARALCDFTKPPKPEEPEGTFAQVVDANDLVWARMPEGGWKCETGAFVAFYELLPNVAAVLSEGVQS